MTKVVKKISKSAGRLIQKKRKLKSRPVALGFTGPEPFDTRKR